jgi:hypothetical protein
MKGIDVVYTEGTLSVDDIGGIHSIRPFTLLVLNLNASEPDEEVMGLCSDLTRELKLRKVLVMGRYASRPSWSDGKTEAVCSPAEIAAWTERL